MGAIAAMGKINRQEKSKRARGLSLGDHAATAPMGDAGERACGVPWRSDPGTLDPERDTAV
jgi:hypothetical protein